MKTCPKCNRNLKESYFFKDATTCDNLSINCKMCINDYFKQYKKERRKEIDGENYNKSKSRRRKKITRKSDK
jgi:hypothetical protein